MFWNKEKHVWNRDFRYSYLCPFAQEKTPVTQPWSFFSPELPLIVARYYRHIRVYFFFDILFFQHRNNKPANITKHRRETFLLHTLLHKCLSHLISFYYRQLRRSSGLGIFKSSCRLRWWEWGYLWTRKKFSWCFQYFCELSDVWKW